MKLTLLKLCTLIVFVLSLSSCCSKHGKIQSFRYHENAKQKPIAALIPLINHVETPQVSWDIAQEITAEIQRRIINRAQVYLNPAQLSSELKAKLNSKDLITLNQEDLKHFKAQNEFVIFMELLEHREVSTNGPKELPSKSLVIQARVRVYDLRGEEPKVLLQQILQSRHSIPRVENNIDYHKVVWGGDSYKASVYGKAHGKLEKELASQIENYITISK